MRNNYVTLKHDLSELNCQLSLRRLTKGGSITVANPVNKFNCRNLRLWESYWTRQLPYFKLWRPKLWFMCIRLTTSLQFDCFRKSIYATQSCLLESKPVKLETSYLYNDPYHYDKERILCLRTRLTCQLIQLLNVPTRARIQNYILFWHWALCSEIIIMRYPSVLIRSPP